MATDHEMSIEALRLFEENGRLLDVLRRHHLWHMRRNTEHAMEYRDSALAADTRAIIAAAETE